VSAAFALEQAWAAGVQIEVDGDNLVLRAPVPPPQSVVSALAEQKLGVMAVLRSRACGWTPEDWLAFFDERAGIAEFEAGLPRVQAEARAFLCCVAKWLDLNPCCSLPGRCLQCGESERAHDPLLRHGTELPGHAWLHSRCWSAWYPRRRAEAISARAEIGITTSADLPNGFGKIGDR
jgi:hypothetical protein